MGRPGVLTVWWHLWWWWTQFCQNRTYLLWMSLSPLLSKHVTQICLKERELNKESGKKHLLIRNRKDDSFRPDAHLGPVARVMFTTCMWNIFNNISHIFLIYVLQGQGTYTTLSLISRDIQLYILGSKLCPCLSMQWWCHHTILAKVSFGCFSQLLGDLDHWRRRLWWKGVSPSKAKGSHSLFKISPSKAKGSHSNEWPGQSLSHCVNFSSDFSAQYTVHCTCLIQKWTIPGTHLKTLVYNFLRENFPSKWMAGGARIGVVWTGRPCYSVTLLKTLNTHFATLWHSSKH